MRSVYLAATVVAFVTKSFAKTCHCLPTEDCWPSQSEWKALNSTVGGHLIKVEPIGAVCHDPTYDEAACEELRASWDDVAVQYVTDSQSSTKSRRTNAGYQLRIHVVLDDSLLHG